MELEKELWNYICDNYLYGEYPSDYSSDMNLIGSGILDSLAILNLVNHLEQAYDIELGTEDFTSENFGTVEVLAALVRRKKLKG
ncbi:MAG: acyl carrier protein [Desulfuromonadales bacterium]|nr:MAG: acyl carrier protein [Desulfuromonadales bacterium]